MGQYQIQTVKVTDSTGTPGDPDDSSTFGVAGNILLGCQIAYTEAAPITSMDIRLLAEDPAGTFRLMRDADNSNISVTGITSSLTRFLFFGGTGAAAIKLHPRGIIIPSPMRIRAVFDATPTSSASLEIWAVYGTSFG